MTREEAIKALKWFKKYNEEDYCGSDRIQDEIGNWYYLISEKDFEAFELAIKALEQENYKTQYEKFSKKAEIVISQLRVDRDRLLEAINKIRAEMLEEMISHSGTGEEVIQAYADGLKKGLDILDKYKAESEKNE